MGRCGCGNNHCNNNCKPVCDPCLKQPKILYCGRPIDCLNIKRGDKLDDIIKTAGDKICQLQGDIDQVSYVNIEDATEEQCEYGGYVIQVLDLGSDNLIEEAIICNAIPLTFQENGVEVSQAPTVNFEDSDTISVEATHDNSSDTTTYTFNTVSTTDITWQEGIDLMDDSLVIPNMLYYITDRGWYLYGVDSNNFSIEGHKVERVVKEEYYIPVALTPTRGVWNLELISVTTGDIVVYGGKVWINNAGVLGTSVDIFTLSNDWTVSNSNLYYEDKVLSIWVDYRDNWVFKQEDDRNNIISIPKPIYNVFGIGRVWADWNMPNMYDNETSLILNNASDKEIQIFGNRGIGKITDNYTEIIKGNVLKSYNGIYGNSISNINENTTNDFYSNSGVSFLDNIFDEECSGNIIAGTFRGNLCRGVVTDNTLPNVEKSTFNGNFTQNSIVPESVNAGIKNSVFLDEITGNTLFRTGIIDSLIQGSTLSNTDIEIIRSQLGNIVINSVIRISSCHVIGGMTGNQDTTITNNKVVLIDGNIGCTISTNTGIEISSNENCNIISNNFYIISNNTHSVLSIIQDNNVKGITSNSEISEIENNELTEGISDNEGIVRINFNKINGSIKNNIPSSLTPTGIEITKNSNNGSIFFNTIDNGVVIESNNNNGDIGTDSIPTNRPASIIGTVVNL